MTPTTQGHLAPFSGEAEEAVLGALLVNPDAFPGVAAFLSADDFYILRHSYIWGGYARIVERDDQIDYVTVLAELTAMNRLNDIGGPAYLLHLMNSAPTSVHAEVYGHLVERAAKRRQLLVAADEIKALALDEHLTVEAVGVSAWQRLEAVNIAGSRETYLPGERSIEHYSQVILDVRGRRERGELVSYELPQDWRLLRAALPAFYLGDFVVVSGASGSGKSAFLESLGEHYAALGLATDYIHTEMSTDEVLHRRMARHSGVSFHQLASGDVAEQPGGYKPYERMNDADDAMEAWVGRIAYHWLPDVKFERLAMQMRRAAMMGVKVFCIDHFQDIVPITERGANEIRALEQMCVWLNAFAEMRRVLVIVASQLNDAGKVKWTRKLVEKADVALNLERPRLKTEFAYAYKGIEYRSQPGEISPKATVTVAKARFGKTGKVEMLYHGPTFCWLDTAQVKRVTRPGKVVNIEDLQAQSRMGSEG